MRQNRAAVEDHEAMPVELLRTDARVRLGLELCLVLQPRMPCRITVGKEQHIGQRIQILV
jgi:hypothetical protein